jgi:hypothetical protein
MVKILAKMTTNTDEFAKVAGLPLEEFTQLVNTNLYGAFIKVLEGSKRAGEGATVLGRMIKEMEISGIGASEVFSKLGSNTDLLSQKVLQTGTALQTTSGVLAEFDIKNSTLGATLNKLGKDFNSLMSSATLISIIKSGVMVVADLIAWLKVLPKTIKYNQVALTILAGAIGVWIAAMTRSLQISALNILLMKEGILLKIKDAVVLEALIIKERLMTFAKTEGTVASKLATIAQWAWNAAMSANPIGLVIAGITALVAAIKYYDSTNRSAMATEAIKLSSMSRMDVTNRLLASSYELINNQIRKLNELSIQEKADLKEKIASSIKLAEIELSMMQARKQKANDSGQATLGQKVWNYVKSSSAADGTAMNQEDAKANGAEAAAAYDAGITKLRENLDRLKGTQTELLNITNAEANADAILGKSLDNLEEKLSKLQTARKNTVAGSEDYLRIQEKIKGVQIEISKFDTSDKTTEEDKKKAKNEALKTSYEKLGTEIKEYIALLQDQVTKDPAQAAVTAKKIKALQEEKAKIDALVESMVDLKSAVGKTDYDQLIEDLKKYNALLQDQVINDPAQAAITAEKIKRLTEEKQKIDELIKSMTEMKELSIDEMLYQMSDGQLGGREETQKESWDRTTEGLLGSFDGSDEEDPQMKAEREGYATAKFVKDAEEVLVYANVVKDTLGALDDWMSNKENLELARDESNNEKKAKNLKGRLNAGMITQKQYDTAIAKMDDDLAKKKRKIEHDQAVRGKAMAVIQAGINVAQGITAALGGTPPASYVLAAITGVLGAIQIAAILGAEVPQAAKGRYNVTGRDDGRLYQNVPWVGTATTGLYATPTLISEAGPEYVIDAKTTKNLQMNYPGVIDAINYARVPQFASGNYPQNSSSSAQVQQDQTMFQEGLLGALNEFNNHARNGIRTFVVYDDVRDSANTINEIENSVKTN